MGNSATHTPAHTHTCSLTHTSFPFITHPTSLGTLIAAHQAKASGDIASKYYFVFFLKEQGAHWRRRWRRRN